MRVTRSILFIIVVFICSSCAKNGDKKVIATVGKTEITLKEFTDRYRNLLKLTGMRDNLKMRHDYLKIVIDEKIILTYADTSGFVRKPEIVNAQNNLRDQVYINYFYEHSIYPELKVKDAELRETFRRSKIRLHTRHLYARTLTEALEMKKRLDNGESFETIARYAFKDPKLALNGGDLGWISYDEMDPAFENAAYSLIPGQISEPVKTRNGYSIIQVLDRRIEPFILEQDYQKNEKWLEMQLKRRKQASFLEDKTDEFLKELHLSFNEESVKELYTHWEEIKDNLLLGNRWLPEIRMSSRNPVILRTGNGQWDVQKTVIKLGELQKKQANRIQNYEDFCSALKGLAIREEIEHQIWKKKIPKKAEVKKSVAQYQTNQITRKFIERFTDTVTIKEDSLKSYFKTHRNEFVAPESFEVSEIAVQDSALAFQIYHQINSKADFKRLARLHSIQERSAKNGGYLGWGDKDQFGWLSDKLMSARVGDIIGPVRYKDRYFIVQLLNKRQPELLSYEDSKSAIVNNLLPEKKKSEYLGFINHLRAQTDIQINNDLVQKFILDVK